MKEQNKTIKNRWFFLGCILILLTGITLFFIDRVTYTNVDEKLESVNYAAVVSDKESVNVVMFKLEDEGLRDIYENSNGIILSDGTKHTRKMHFGFWVNDEFYAYCIQLGTLATTGNKQAFTTSTYWENFNSVQKAGIDLATVFGFPNKIRSGYSNELQYIVTQTIIWEFEHGWRTNYEPLPSNRTMYDTFISKDSRLVAVYNSIIRDMKEYSSIPSFAGRNESNVSSVTLDYDSKTGIYTQTFTDTNNLLSGLDVNCPSGLTCKKTGNNTLVITTKTPGNYTIELSKEIPNNLKQGKLILDDNSSQRMIFGKANINESVSYLKLKTEVLGNITIEKISEDGIKNGFTFEVTGPNNFKKTVTTDQNGKATLNNLELGDYYITEVDIPTRYEVIPTRKVTLSTSGFNVTQTFNNILINNSVVKVVKVDSETEEYLEDAKLEIRDGNKVIETWTSGDNVYVVKSTLAINKVYNLCEVSAPLGYNPLTNCQEFKLENKNQTLNLIMKNDPNVAFISKVDSNGNFLAGAHLQLVDSKNTIIDEWVSDGTKHTIKKLVSGQNYILREIKAPEGYTRASDISFIAKNNIELKMKNQKTKTLISKQDITTGEEIAGAHLEILDSNNSKIAEWISEKDKSYVIEGLIAGKKYTLKETIAPDGYAISNSISFVVDSDNLTKVEMKDELTKVLISKQDATTNKEIAGAHLQIIDENGNIKEEWISEEGKTKLIQGLTNGHSYTLRETIAPYGYAISEEIIFVVGDKEKIVMKNKTTELIVEKRDIVSNEIVKGAHLQLLDSNGNVVDEWDSTSSPKVIVGLPVLNEYIIRETKPPKNYLVSEDIKFSISSTEDSKTIVVYNTPIIQAPNTASNISIYAVLGGVVLLFSGIAIILWMKKRNS